MELLLAGKFIAFFVALSFIFLVLLSIELFQTHQVKSVNEKV